MAAQPKQSEDPDEVDRAFLARVLGVDVRTIANLVTEGMPKLDRGRFSLSVCVPWYVDRETAAARAKKPLNDLDVARQRKTEAEAERTELELARLRGDQVSVESFRSTVSTIAQRVRAQLLAAPGRYSARIVGCASLPAAQRVLDEIVRDIIAELREG